MNFMRLFTKAKIQQPLTHRKEVTIKGENKNETLQEKSNTT